MLGLRREFLVGSLGIFFVSYVFFTASLLLVLDVLYLSLATFCCLLSGSKKICLRPYFFLHHGETMMFAIFYLLWP